MIKAVIFDLDGTLLNTLEGLMDSVNYSLNEFNYPIKSIDEIKSFVGNGVSKLVERAIPEGVKNPNFEKCLAIFKEHYSKTMQQKTKPYPKITELLIDLKSENIKVAVVSNKYDLAVKDLCNKYFPDLIDIALGESKFCRPKPDTDGIDKVLVELNLKKDEVLYVGDSEVDILTAQNASIKMIGVSWGFRDVNCLKKNGADIIINNAFELLDFIAFA